MRMETSDEDLARAAAGGDRGAFAVLVDRVYDKLFGLSFRLTGTREEAEDLVQDICLALPAKLGTFKGQAKFTTWLYRVAVNAAHDRRRRQAAHARASLGWGDVELGRIAAAAEHREGTAWLMAAMGTLPDDLRDTLALVLEDDLTHAQAGEILGLSEGTVSWRLSQARKHLRDLHETEQDT